MFFSFFPKSLNISSTFLRIKYLSQGTYEKKKKKKDGDDASFNGVVFGTISDYVIILLFTWYINELVFDESNFY